jgi:hypothetical protein
MVPRNVRPILTAGVAIDPTRYPSSHEEPERKLERSLMKINDFCDFHGEGIYDP